MTAVTPLLWVGECHFDHVRATSAAEAVAVIRDGRTVLVEDFDAAEDVLRALGADPATLDYRLAQARRRHRDDLPD